MKDKLDPGKWLMRLVSPRGGASPPLESVGRALQRFVEACGGEAHPDGIFECSLRFLFRVAFLAHFSSALGERPCPREAPLRAAFLDIARRAAAGPPPGREGESGLWESLLKLFRAAGRGGGAAPAPLGGIFSPAQATLLEKHGLFRDGALCAVLSAVLAGPDGSPLDFASVPLPLLGSLHQKLTDYGFRTAEEDLELAPAGPGRAKGEPARRIAKGELYLLRLPRNRKTGGAYYTPESLAGHLAGKGVGRLLDTVFRKPPSAEYKTTERGESRENAEGAEGARGTRAPQGTQAAPGPRIARPGEITAPVRAAHDGEEAPLPSLLEMRILDSSCGSGGLLVAALGALADEALERLESDGPLKKAVEEETRAVLANLAAAAAEPAAAAAEGPAPEGYAASDRESRDLRRVIVKRVLLRRAIHGVDLSSFAVELARHALRMEAFIPGTPLPFLEHRIRLGNSLIGQGPGAAARLSGESGEARAFRRGLSRLREIASAVSDLDDGTFAGAAAAERLFRKKAEPLRRRLDSLLDSLTGEDLLEADKDGAARGKADGAARDGEPGPGAARPRPGAGFSGGEAS
ncbi:MAG: hypothetical protein LBW85_06545, partial [Deltaproteobacteria bacterium]|nr:hypothetical protein [Deltaproteobacteria bacterium]